MKTLSVLLLIPFLLMPNFVTAEEDSGDSESIVALKKALFIRMPNVKPDKITESPIKGLYQVVVGNQIIYMTKDTRYMFDGEFYDLKEKKSISDDAKADIRIRTLQTLPVDQMLVYRPKKVKDVITVITDIDCPYCRRLHEEVPDYLKENIEVRYIFMPLKGAEDKKKTISVWCSDDRQLALDIAKAGGEIDEKTCKNPIKQHQLVAQALGIRGTPAILFEDGQLISGYVPFDKLVAALRK